MKKAFTMIEMLLVLVLSLTMLMLLQPIVQTLKPTNNASNQFLSLLDFQLRLAFVNDMTVVSKQLLIADDIEYRCEQDSLYITPGYQPLLFDLPCSFEKEDYVYLVTPLGRYLLGE